MQPPIIVGNILQNRYRIIHIIGQGGFSRIYLAEDQRRFNELCAVKELILTTGTVSGEKAQELFEREAAILYRIEHPQIPKFREKFAQDQHLFLVEDYIFGKNYQTLLAERQSIGQVFSEPEVLELFRSLLPVLNYIHTLGIIHRDISPENIILRDSDSKPVLIDFGVVRELATKLQSTSPNPVTTVGKLGYAPREQIQTGSAYPSSDLYALAVTGIVLLTGKEPTILFDQTQLTWNWEDWVKINPKFGQILDKMLRYQPGERYQTANEVLQALESVDLPVANFASSPGQTLAVGQSLPKNDAPVVASTANNSILDNPIAVGFISIAVVLLAGLGSWTFVNSLQNHDKHREGGITPQTFPSPIISGGTNSTLSSTPISTPTIPPNILKKRLNFSESGKITVHGYLMENDLIKYSFFGKSQQMVTVSVDQGLGIILAVYGPDGQLLANESHQVATFQTILRDRGRYIIQLSLAPKVAESKYSLNVTLDQPVKFNFTPKPKTIPLPKTTPTPTSSPLIISPTPEVSETPQVTVTPDVTPDVTPSDSPMEMTPTPSPS